MTMKPHPMQEEMNALIEKWHKSDAIPMTFFVDAVINFWVDVAIAEYKETGVTLDPGEVRATMVADLEELMYGEPL